MLFANMFGSVAIIGFSSCFLTLVAGDLGCFQLMSMVESKDQIGQDKQTLTTEMSIEYCRDFCSDHKYFLAEAGCYCANSISTLKPCDAVCSSPCMADESEVCGNQHEGCISAYEVATADSAPTPVTSTIATTTTTDAAATNTIPAFPEPTTTASTIATPTTTPVATTSTSTTTTTTTTTTSTTVPASTARASSTTTAGSSYVPPNQRKDCGYKGITRAQCLKDASCVWDDTVKGVIWCYAKP